MLDALSPARVILPELFDHPGLWPAAVERAEYVAGRGDFTLTLGAVLLGLPARTIRQVIRRWGGSNELGDSVCWLAEHRDDWKQAADMPLCEFKRLMARRHFDDLRVLWRFEERQADGRNVLSRRIARRAAGIGPENVAPPPLVDGADLKRMGLAEGPRLGGILRGLYDAQLNEELATREQALRRAKELISRQ
jgi:poly(A) polymerase